MQLEQTIQYELIKKKSIELGTILNTSILNNSLHYKKITLALSLPIYF